MDTATNEGTSSNLESRNCIGVRGPSLREVHGIDKATTNVILCLLMTVNHLAPK